MMSEEGSEYKRLVEEIARVKGLSVAEVEEMVEKKIREFEGLIKKDAAALMLARSLGVEAETAHADVVGSLKLADLVPGFFGIEVEGVVIERGEPRESRRGDLFARLIIADETAAVPLVAWGPHAAKLRGVSLGDKAVFRNVSVRRRGNGVEVVFSERSSVEVEGSVEPGTLWRLSREYEARTLVLECGAASCSARACCLYGFTPDGTPASLMVPGELGEADYTRRVIAASRVSLRGTSPISARLYRGGVIDVVAGGQASREMGDVRGEFSLSGVLAGYIVFRAKGGRLFIVGGETPAAIAVFDDEEFLEAARSLGREVEVWGFRKSTRGLVANDCFKLNVLGPAAVRYSEGRLVEGGWIRASASLLDMSVYTRCMGNEVLVTLRMLIDDGVGRVRAFTSGVEALGRLLGLGPEDVCGEGAESIVEFAVEEARGADYVFSGFNDVERKVMYVLEVEGD